MPAEAPAVANAANALALDVEAAEGTDATAAAAETPPAATLSPKRKTLRNRLRLRSRSSPSNSSASPSVRRADAEQPIETADSPIDSAVASDELTPKKSRSLIALVTRVARRNSKGSPSVDATAEVAASPPSSKQRGRKFSARLLNVGVNSAKVGIEFDKPYVKPPHRHASTSTSIDELLDAAAAAAAADSDGFAYDDAAAAEHNGDTELQDRNADAASNDVASLHDFKVNLSTAAVPTSPIKVRSSRANSRSRSPAASIKSITSVKSNTSVKSTASVRSTASIRSGRSVKSSSSSKRVTSNTTTAAATANDQQFHIVDVEEHPAASYQRATVSSSVASEARKVINKRSPSPSQQQQQQQHKQHSSRSASPRSAPTAAANQSSTTATSTSADTNGYDVEGEHGTDQQAAVATAAAAAAAVINGSDSECDGVSESSEFASVNDTHDDDVASNSDSSSGSVHRDDRIHQHSIHSKHSRSGILNSSAIRSISSSYIASPITSPQHLQQEQQQQQYQQQHDWVDAALSKGRLTGLNDEQMTALLAANTTSNCNDTPTSVHRERNHSSNSVDGAHDAAQLLQHDADAHQYSDDHLSDDDDVDSGSGFDSVYSNNHHNNNNSNSNGQHNGTRHHSDSRHRDSPIQLQQRSVLQLDTTTANATDSNAKHTTTSCWDRLHGEHEQRQQWLYDIAQLQQQHARMQSTQGSKQRHTTSKHQRSSSAAMHKQQRSVQYDNMFDSGSGVDDVNAVGVHNSSSNNAELLWHVRLSVPKGVHDAANHYNPHANDGTSLESYIDV
jgi:trimeric autotransporter adhesin